jgi:15-cis-phytoene synthase
VATGGGRTVPVHAAILSSARASEPDRYLAALLAPAAVRADLLALTAFSAELARIPYAARREPAMAAVRWRWWRDALELPSAVSTGHPIADGLRAAIGRHRLKSADLLALVEARASDLEPQPFADDAALAGYLAHSQGPLFALAAEILAGPGHASAPAWSDVAGQAYGLARLLMDLPAALARGHLPIPLTRLPAGLEPQALSLPAQRDLYRGLVADLGQRARTSLAQARRDVTKLPREALFAVLPLALVESYLRASTRAARQARLASVAPLSRFVRLAAARMLGRP